MLKDHAGQNEYKIKEYLVLWCFVKPKDYRRRRKSTPVLMNWVCSSIVKKGFCIRPCQILTAEKFKIKKNNLCDKHDLKENWMADAGFCPHMHLI